MSGPVLQLAHQFRQECIGLEGVQYAVIDRELGWQTLTLGPEYPVMDDPSLWGEAVLAGA